MITGLLFDAHTLTVSRPAYASDGMGGRTRTPSPVGEVEGRVSQPSASERAFARTLIGDQQASAELDVVVHTEPDTPARRGDTLTFTDHTGTRTLRVIAHLTPSTVSYARLGCQEIQPQPEEGAL